MTHSCTFNTFSGMVGSLSVSIDRSAASNQLKVQSRSISWALQMGEGRGEERKATIVGSAPFPPKNAHTHRHTQHARRHAAYLNVLIQGNESKNFSFCTHLKK